MTIYHKITVALLVSILLIETYAFLGNRGLGHFLIAFIYGGFIFAGAFFFVSVVDKFAQRKRRRKHLSFSEPENLENKKKQSQKPYNGMKIVR